MKSCIIKGIHDTRIYNRNVFFEEIKNINPYYFFFDTPWVGIILAFEADFLILNQIDENILSNYDFIFTLNPILQRKYREDQKLFYFETEPADLSPLVGRYWDSLNQHPIEPYDFLLNNYEIQTNNNRNIPFHYYYDLNSFIKYEKQEKLFLLQRRSVYENDNIILWRESNYHPHYDVKFKEYQEKMSRSQASINLCKNHASGQIIAESILSNTPCFSTINKLFAKILLPDEYIVNDANDVNNKIENNVYNNKELLEYAKSNIYKIDYNNAKKYLLERIF
jgi:hypothetical protein